MTNSTPGSAAQDAQEGAMTTAAIEVDDDAAEGFPRRIVLITVAVLLPADFEETALTDFIETRVQEARLVMT